MSRPVNSEITVVLHRGATHPLRSPGWRWDRAHEVAATRVALDERDDGYVIKTIKYLRAVNRMLTGRSKHTKAQMYKAQATLVRKYPAMVNAVELYKSGATMRWIVEALVVGQATVSDIAGYTGYQEEDIEAYEHVFFDVRDRLSRSAFLATSIFAKLDDGRAEPHDKDVFWKLIAHKCGAPKLLPFIDHSDDEVLNEWVASQMNVHLNRNGLMAVLSRDVNNFSAHEIIEEAPVFHKLVAEATGNGPRPKGDEDLVSGMLSAVTFSMRGLRAPERAPSEFRQGDGLKRLIDGNKRDRTDNAVESKKEGAK